MDQKRCSDIASGKIQKVFVELEDVSGILQRPTPGGYVLPAGNATLNQTPQYSNSEEKSGSPDILRQTRNALQAGEASIPMLVRLPADGSKMQGHALFEALMGKTQEPGTVTAVIADGGDVDESAAAINVSGVTGGFFPRRGVVRIDAEDIRYVGITTDASGAVTALTGCVRGYAGTVAASHTAGTSMVLRSRVYSQDNCRSSVSVWTLFDHTVLFASGGVVTQASVPQSRDGDQHADFTVQFRRMGWCGRSYLSAVPSTGVLSVKTEDGESAADAYSVGAIIKNVTKKDDNGGAGYTVTDADYDNGTITVSPVPLGWAEDDRLEPWLPEASPVGEPLAATNTRVFIDGKAGKLTEGSITLGAPTSFAGELGDEYPGENADGWRALTISNGLYFRAKDAVEFKRGYDGYNLPVDVVLGNKAGASLALAMPRVQFNMPSVTLNDDFVTLTREGAILGTKGNDSLYIIQE